MGAGRSTRGADYASRPLPTTLFFCWGSFEVVFEVVLEKRPPDAGKLALSIS